MDSRNSLTPRPGLSRGNILVLELDVAGVGAANIEQTFTPPNTLRPVASQATTPIKATARSQQDHSWPKPEVVQPALFFIAAPFR